jgi:hypothetical protein
VMSKATVEVHGLRKAFGVVVDVAGGAVLV